MGGFAALSSPVSAAAPTTSDPAAERALRAASSGPVTISRGTDGVARFVGTTAGKPVRRPAGLAASATAETVARAHLARYGAIFGLRDQASELRSQRVTRAAANQQIVRFGQLLGGLPVLGGELTVALDSAGNMLSVNGETARAAGTTTFTIPSAAAAKTAIGSAAKANRVPASSLRATAPARWMYDASLVSKGKQTSARSVWRVEVTNTAAVRQLVLVDAATGAVALSFNQIAYAKERHVCDFNNVQNTDNTCSPGNTARDEGDAATGVTDVDLAYDYSGDTYDFYNAQFGRDSIDDAGMKLISTVRFCPEDTCPGTTFQNAFWDGSQMTYGDGFANADDVVAHELTHGVTEFTSGLLYYYQSGAINESMSDIFGEFVDLTNSAGTDTAPTRWLLGEDLPIGAIRDMQDPAAFDQPAKTSSPLWDSLWYDAGGVHQNSGVGNEAAYLMTDGDTFNGKTVTGLGVNKVAAIYYEAQQLLTSGSDYKDLYNVLQQSCANLVGTQGITVANCVQVTNAVNAVEMNVYPANDPPLPAKPVACPGTSLFADNFDGTLAQWTQTPAGQWSIDGSYQPNPASGTALFGPDDESSQEFSIATTTPFLVPTGKTAQLTFDHAFAFDWLGFDPATPDAPDAFFDGGLVEISTDNGATWGTLYPELNGYNHTLEPPITGPTWSGDSTDWITSQTSLTSYAGQSVNLRFLIVTDGVAAASAAYGWWIDNLKVVSCDSKPRADFTGDARADHAVFRPSNGTWYFKVRPALPFGTSGDVPQAGDFVFDAKSDVTVWRPSNGNWYVRGEVPVQHGASTDRPVAADYNGDGHTDMAVWRPSNGTWYVRGQAPVAFGKSGDIPVVADWTGDSKADIAVWRPSDGKWYVRGLSAVAFGTSGDQPLALNFIGGGKADFAVRRPSNGTWYVRGQSAVAFGTSTDVAVPGDFTGDGLADIAVWRPSNGTWYIRNGSVTQLGRSGDIPLSG